MHTLTAIIRAKPGHADTVAAELAKVGDYAAVHEPGHGQPFSSHRIPMTPCLFTTYERFTDAAARDQHNNGPGSQGFFAAAGDLLEGDVTVATGSRSGPPKAVFDKPGSPNAA